MRKEELDRLAAGFVETVDALRQNKILRAHNAVMRTALEQIVAEAQSDDGLTAWDGGDIARDALALCPLKPVGGGDDGI